MMVTFLGGKGSVGLNMECCRHHILHCDWLLQGLLMRVLQVCSQEYRPLYIHMLLLTLSVHSDGRLAQYCIYVSVHRSSMTNLLLQW